jgi:hypothetical protein
MLSPSSCSTRFGTRAVSIGSGLFFCLLHLCAEALREPLIVPAGGTTMLSGNNGRRTAAFNHEFFRPTPQWRAKSHGSGVEILHVGSVTIYGLVLIRSKAN